MHLKYRIWLILSGVTLGVLSLFGIVEYREVEEHTRAQIHRQALDLRATLMATRRVYHKQFLASGLPLNDYTLGFLPAHALSRISLDFQNWSSSGVRFNNVSDRPRNPANRADADELAAMAWFRANPSAEEYVATLRGRDGREYYQFAAPIWTEAYCLTCHAGAEAAPPTIRERYSAGYGYQAGDLRGIMSIRIPLDTVHQAAMTRYRDEIIGLAALLATLLLTLGPLLNRYVTRRIQALHAAAERMTAGDYSVRLEDPLRDEIGELSRCFNSMTAAIEQREKALGDSEQKFRILADYSSEWEFWLNPDGSYRYVSPACARITGHAPEEFMADPGLMEHLLHPADRPIWNQHLGDVVDPVKPAHAILSMRIRAADGDYRWIEHACVPVFDDAGAYLGRRGINHDITARKRAEELERFSAFQAGIAEMGTSVLHNIGNAITAVTQDSERVGRAGNELKRVAGLLEANAGRCKGELHDPDSDAAALLQHQCAIQHEAARVIRELYAEDLQRPARRLTESARHIADIVRIQQSVAVPNSHRSSFSLTQAIHAALEMQGDAFSKHGIQVTVLVDPDIDLVHLSHNHMLQALVNVIRNSIEAISQGDAEERGHGRLDIRAVPLNTGRLRLTVEDNGAGFDPAIREDLFRYGFSTKQRGTGFGLPSVAVFAQEAGGQVALDSPGPGLGATLTLDLPLGHGTDADKCEP